MPLFARIVYASPSHGIYFRQELSIELCLFAKTFRVMVLASGDFIGFTSIFSVQFPSTRADAVSSTAPCRLCIPSRLSYKPVVGVPPTLLCMFLLFFAQTTINIWREKIEGARGGERNPRNRRLCHSKSKHCTWTRKSVQSFAGFSLIFNVNTISTSCSFLSWFRWNAVVGRGQQWDAVSEQLQSP